MELELKLDLGVVDGAILVDVVGELVEVVNDAVVGLVGMLVDRVGAVLATHTRSLVAVGAVCIPSPPHTVNAPHVACFANS